MYSQQTLLLVTSDSAMPHTVAAALESNGHFVTGNVCRDLQELVSRLEQRHVPAVLVDVDPWPVRVLAELDPIIRRFEHTRFIVLSRDYNNELVLEAMQIGARHFLLKRSIESELAGALDRLVSRQSAHAPQTSSIVTIHGASGGCGATTLAINLANELHLETSEDVLLIDLDYAYGAVGTYLGLEGEYGIADVLADRARIDAQLIASTAVACSEGVRALISPTSARAPSTAPLLGENLLPALEACKQAYRYIVIDAPRVSQDVAAQLALASRLALIVVQMNVKDVRTARALLSELTERGVPRDRLVVVVNRYRRRRSIITLDDVAAAVGNFELRTVKNDFKCAISAANIGQPLARAAPRSRIRRDVRRLAKEMVDAQQPSAPRTGGK